MKYFMTGLILCVTFLLGLAVQQEFRLLDIVPVPTPTQEIANAIIGGPERDKNWKIITDYVNSDANTPRVTEENRRANYLMPQKDTATYKEWVTKYGDSAESWELFTLSFHTRYLQELTKKVNALSRGENEPNQPIKPN